MPETIVPRCETCGVADATHDLITCVWAEKFGEQLREGLILGSLDHPYLKWRLLGAVGHIFFKDRTHVTGPGEDAIALDDFRDLVERPRLRQRANRAAGKAIGSATYVSEYSVFSRPKYPSSTTVVEAARVTLFMHKLLYVLRVADAVAKGVSFGIALFEERHRFVDGVLSSYAANSFTYRPVLRFRPVGSAAVAPTYVLPTSQPGGSYRTVPRTARVVHRVAWSGRSWEVDKSIGVYFSPYNHAMRGALDRWSDDPLALDPHGYTHEIDLETLGIEGAEWRVAT